LERKEDSYYRPVMEKLRQLFASKGREVHLEITVEGFSNKLKDAIPDHKAIIFSFLGAKGARPDISGFVSEKYSKYFIVVEIKNERMKLDDVYQLRKYADLFDAKFAFLISTYEIPSEIKKLSKAASFLLWRSGPFPHLTLVSYDNARQDFAEWFEENPFQEEVYWR